MLRIAIIEDEQDSIRRLQDVLERYGEDASLEFDVRMFANPIRFLDGYRADYDIVFLDIDMPGMNGMDAARELRKMDEEVALVFVTNLARFAANGYEVNALDFIVKPVEYDLFKVKLDRVLRFVERDRVRKVMVKTSDGIRIVRLESLRFVEVSAHYLFFHTDDGIFKTRGSLKEVESQLSDASFVLCNKCYLINLARVQAMGKQDINVGGEVIQVSRLKRNEVLAALSDYYGGRHLNS